MPRTIIVSDLHVETWDNRAYGKGRRKKTKLKHWIDFLRWCDQKGIDELVINGDLLDAPPYEGDNCFPTPISKQAITRLVAYARNHKVTYVYGNHDIGISGLRCDARSSLKALSNINLFYPDYILKTRRSTLVIQHGHLFDPGLILYIKDLTTRTYIQTNFEAFQRVQQRWDPSRRVKPDIAGVASPATIDSSLGVKNDLYHAILVTEHIDPPTEEDNRAARTFINKLKRGWVSKAADYLVRRGKHYLWWEAAKSVFDDYLEEFDSRPPTLYCIMGHTHVPDAAETRRDGVKCIYFNSGTWTGAGSHPQDRQHATYLDVREDGKVWIQDWIHSRYLN